MGISDRDYMRGSPEDRKRIASYENSARTREYGNQASGRRRTIKAGLCVIAVVVVALVLFQIIASLAN